ncbi:hypothetical protein ALC56_13769 [Trachymyrmex septentrionalis]|uniref:Uncharacterized protein n=1 Tax=Trachymyrmex septentrionalis TaxID=34720 RepID=A0A195EV37_9HYME|nr:hypothetical protein ALC56_13769 [Trachymyrmex septentrionalis]
MVRNHRNGRGNKNDKLTLRRARQNASDTQPHARPTRTWRTCPLPMVLLSTAPGKGLKMLDALERVLKGLKPVSRGPLPSALIEISLSRFYYLGMDAAWRIRTALALRINLPVPRGNERLYHTPGPVREARPPYDSLSDIHTTIGQNNTERSNEREWGLQAFDRKLFV